MGPEYKRSRMLRAAELLREVKLGSPGSQRHLAVSYWTEEKRHAIEILNLETSRSARFLATSALDVPTYAEIIEAVMSRCRV